MVRRSLSLAVIAASFAFQCAAQDGPNKVLKTEKIGGVGGFDYVYADASARKLYIPRLGASPRIVVLNLDTLAPEAEILAANAHGVAVDEASHHAFGSSKPVTMWDSQTLKPIKTIDVEGGPDGIFADPFNGHIYVFSHRAPNATVIDGKDGSILGTIDLGGAPEQAVSDGKGHVYVDIEDKASIAVIDAKTMTVTGHFDLTGKGDGCAGLAIDVKHELLFASCREPQNMVVVSIRDSKVLETLPLGKGSDGAVFNPKTDEAFSSQGDGTLTIIKEKSPTSFAVEQTVTTPQHAKTLTLDTKTGNILLIAADFTPPTPPTEPGGRPGRGQVIPETFSVVVVGK